MFSSHLLDQKNKRKRIKFIKIGIKIFTKIRKSRNNNKYIQKVITGKQNICWHIFITYKIYFQMKYLNMNHFPLLQLLHSFLHFPTLLCIIPNLPYCPRPFPDLPLLLLVICPSLDNKPLQDLIHAYCP